MSHQSASDRTSVGVLGLGNLGLAIAARLAATGFDVAGSDVSPRRTEELAKNGSRIGAVEVITSDILCVVTPDERALLEFLDDHSPQIAERVPDVVIVCSTIRPDAVLSVGERLAAIGTELVEAPVSGGAAAAGRGELSMMIGGSPAGVSSAEPVLAALATRRFVFSEPGAASAMKLANQVALYSSLAGVLEGLALVRSFGVEDALLKEVFQESTADSWAARNLPFFFDLVRQYDEADVELSHRPWRKDISEFAKVARERATSHRFVDTLADAFGDDLERFAHTDGGGK